MDGWMDGWMDGHWRDQIQLRGVGKLQLAYVWTQVYTKQVCPVHFPLYRLKAVNLETGLAFSLSTV